MCASWKLQKCEFGHGRVAPEFTRDSFSAQQELDVAGFVVVVFFFIFEGSKFFPSLRISVNLG